jgi:hypothetical protein
MAVKFVESATQKVCTFKRLVTTLFLSVWLVLPAGTWAIFCGDEVFADDWELYEYPIKSEYLNFGEALEHLKRGKRVAREGWNGKGMWLQAIPANGYMISNGPTNPTLPWIGMKTADDKFVPWVASQTDILAEDWRVVE